MLPPGEGISWAGSSDGLKPGQGSAMKINHHEMTINETWSQFDYNFSPQSFIF